MQFAARALFVVLTPTLLFGCAGRPALFPNSDKSLNKTSTQFAADAAKRFPFKSDLPRSGEAVGRAQVGYMVDQLEIANLSDEDWNNIEIWVNERYVVGIPHIDKNNQRVKTINFQMLYNSDGNYFPTDNSVPARQIQTVELVRDGKIYTIPLQLAD